MKQLIFLHQFRDGRVALANPAREMRLDIVTTKFSKVRATSPAKPARNLPASIEEAAEVLTELAKCIGEYESPGDLSRAIAVIMTPWCVAMGLLTPQQCPPCRIIPKEAKARFSTILDAIYGGAAKQGCRLL